jgi:glycosyltransferase involved in cell wall biosynthesis
LNNQISIVIIAKNEEHIIGKTLAQAVKISDDVILIDSGSEDNTVKIANDYGVKVYSVPWNGYGPTKNFGAQKAKYDWILSIDADEVADDLFVKAIKNLKLDINAIYQIKIDTYFAKKKIRNDLLSPMWRYRLYYKNDHQWNENLVHEKLTNIQSKETRKLKGSIFHFSYRDADHQRQKLDRYAMYQAKDWLKSGFKPNISKLYFSAMSRFIKHYIFHFGFLYGKEGFTHAINEYEMVKKQVEYYKNSKG